MEEFFQFTFSLKCFVDTKKELLLKRGANLLIKNDIFEMMDHEDC